MNSATIAVSSHHALTTQQLCSTVMVSMTTTLVLIKESVCRSALSHQDAVHVSDNRKELVLMLFKILVPEIGETN